MALVWAWMLCFLLAFFHSAVAREFVVGGRQGWVVPAGVEPDTYNQWAGKNRFLIGDTLLFNYNPAEDSVLQVTTQHYDACNTSRPIASYKGGNTVFRLPRQGPFHFISGNRSNCQKGEKLIVMVLSPRNRSHGALSPTVVSPGPSVVAPSPSFAGAPAPAPKVPSSSPSLAPVVPVPSPSFSSSPSPAPVVLLPSPSSSSSPSPAPVIPVPSPSSSPTLRVPSPSSSPTPVVPVSSPASSPGLSAPSISSPPASSPGLSTPSAPENAPTASSPPPSASPPPMLSALNLVMPLLFLALKILTTNY